jgi:hypothetical protein
MFANSPRTERAANGAGLARSGKLASGQIRSLSERRQRSTARSPPSQCRPGPTNARRDAAATPAPRVPQGHVAPHPRSEPRPGCAPPAIASAECGRRAPPRRPRAARLAARDRPAARGSRETHSRRRPRPTGRPETAGDNADDGDSSRRTLGRLLARDRSCRDPPTVRGRLTGTPTSSPTEIPPLARAAAYTTRVGAPEWDLDGTRMEPRPPLDMRNVAVPRMFDTHRTIAKSDRFAASLCEPLRGGESGRRGSNPRPSAWEADALPTELHPQVGGDASDRELRDRDRRPARPPAATGRFATGRSRT